MYLHVGMICLQLETNDKNILCIFFHEREGEFGKKKKRKRVLPVFLSLFRSSNVWELRFLPAGSNRLS